jgi:hypothetical protein
LAGLLEMTEPNSVNTQIEFAILLSFVKKMPQEISRGICLESHEIRDYGVMEHESRQDSPDGFFVKSPLLTLSSFWESSDFLANTPKV